MIKQGIVIKTKGKTAYLLTSTGEFTRVKVKNEKPTIGELFEGNYSKGYKFITNLSKVTLFILLLSFFITINIYYTPKTSIIIDLNPCIKLEINRFNKIVNPVSLNSDGSKILKDLKIKNKNIDNGLVLILEKCKKENIINDKFIKENKKITIYITNTSTSLELNNVKKYILDNNLTLEINNNGQLILVK